MKKNILQRLQGVKLNDLLHIFLFVIAIIPACIYKLIHDDFWLISECDNEARDNGYYFFEYMCNNHKEQDVVYAIKKDCYDYMYVSHLGKTVEFGSLMHWIMYLSCSVKISTQKNGGPNDAVCYMMTKIGVLKHKVVFLQHGVIKDDLPYIHSDEAKFDLFITTSKRETDYVKANFGFDDRVVKQIGLCRYDSLLSDKKKDLSYLHNDNIKRFILFAPTWRQWIANPDYGTTNVEPTENFTETNFFRRWNMFLQSDKLPKILEKNDIYVVFHLHRKMQKYMQYFKSVSDRIIISDSNLNFLIRDASMLVTDYSSIAMDFAYMEKPIIYYQFDYLKFRKNHLSEGYFDYQKDGFGIISSDLTFINNEIERLSINDFKIDEKYKSRADEFFDLKDTDNCKRTYEAIYELGR